MKNVKKYKSMAADFKLQPGNKEQRNKILANKGVNLINLCRDLELNNLEHLRVSKDMYFSAFVEHVVEHMETSVKKEWLKHIQADMICP